MSRFYLRLSIMFILLFSTSSILLIALGSTQPIHPALRGFVEGCEGIAQPCWYGIVPGVSTLDESHEIVRNIGFNVLDVTDDILDAESNDIGCQLHIDAIFSNRTINSIQLFQCKSLKLGDVISLFGEPNMVLAGPDGNGSFSLNLIYNSAWMGRIYAPVSILESENRNIWSIVIIADIFGSSASLQPDGIEQMSWHGFVPWWRYCELEPHYIYFCGHSSPP